MSFFGGLKSQCFLMAFLLFLPLGTLAAEPSKLDTLVVSSEEPSARKVVRLAIEHMRGRSSKATAKMTVHRPDWQRESRFVIWTEGNELSLVRFVRPRKDAGNASLTIQDEIWSFSPKTNRVIKIPSSMKGQSWMGSDYSYQDLSKDDEILDQYQHRVLSKEELDGQLIYTIEAVPFDSAPVVWGKEVLKIREDNNIIEHLFFDQEGKLLKRYSAKRIEMFAGRMYPTLTRMEKLEEEGSWTEVEHLSAEFDLEIDSSVFTVANMQRSTP